MAIDRRRFGRTGLEVPAVTFGGGWVGGLLIRGTEEERECTLNKALDAGIDWIDTAALYGKGVSETMIGKWLSGRVAEARPRISTKFNIDIAAGNIEDQVFRTVEESFERLGVDHVQLIILHNQIVADGAAGVGERSIRPDDILRPGGAADIMEKLREKGLCDWLGMTALGDPAALHTVVDAGRFGVAQVYYNMLNPTAREAAGAGWNTTDFNGLLGRCAAQDMGVMGIRIFAAGLLASTERHGRENDVTDNAENAIEEARAEAVFAALGSEYGTRAQTALRFGLGNSDISTIVVGIGETWHFDQVLEAAEQGPLPEAALEKLRDIWKESKIFREAA